MHPLSVVALLLAICANGTIASHEVSRRWLATPQPAGCNETLGYITLDQTLEVGLIVLEQLVENPPLTRDILFQNSKYDLEVRRMCTSCRYVELFFLEIDEQPPGDWRDYCNETSYGYSVFQSFLAFFPVTPNGTIVTGTKLRPFLSLRSSTPDETLAPTVAWPRNISDALIRMQAGELPLLRESGFVQFVPSLLAASSGSVAIMPDYHGFGESSISRVFYWPQGYKQSAITSWLHTREYLHRYVPCAELDLSSITVQGFEDGALGAFVTSLGLRRFDRMDILRTISSSGVLDIDTLLADAILRVRNGETLGDRLIQLLEMAAYSFSWGHQDMPNTGLSQELVSPDERARIIATYRLGRSGRRELQGGQLSFLNPTLVQYYLEELGNDNMHPCRGMTSESPYFDQLGVLCTTINLASAWPTIRGETTFEWAFDSEFCYSVDNPIISPAMVESGSLPSSASWFIDYKGPIGEVASDDLRPLGNDHTKILSICGVGPAGLFYVLQGHRPDDPARWPNFRAELSPDARAVCRQLSPDDPINDNPDDDGGDGDDDDRTPEPGDEDGTSGNSTDPGNGSPTDPSSPTIPSSPNPEQPTGSGTGPQPTSPSAPSPSSGSGRTVLSMYGASLTMVIGIAIGMLL